MNEETNPLLRVPTKDSWLLPGAIVVAGIILAVTVYRSNITRQVVGTVEGDPAIMRAVGPDDHIIGNPQAPVVLVEYADIDSKPAKGFQKTMEQLMVDYAAGGKVAWVYRHLPLIDQHPNAKLHAEAAECAASLGGGDIFWRFISALNAQAPDDIQFSPRNYDPVVAALGLDTKKFDACMSSGTFEKRVTSDFANGLAVGAGGSPFTLLVIKGQPIIPIDGTLPYESMKKIVDEALIKAAK